jgi:hypothetical protein
MFFFDEKVNNGKTNASDCTCELFFVFQRGDEVASDVVCGKGLKDVGGFELFENMVRWKVIRANC